MKKARNKSKKSGALLQGKTACGHQPDEARKHHPLLGLQRSAGNRAVVGLLESDGHPQTNRRVLSAGGPQIQRAPRTGHPASHEPEPSSFSAGPLIVDDDVARVAPSQMRKSEFLEQLRSAVCATADAALEEAGESRKGCPFLEQWLSYYAEREPAHIERALRKYAPEAATATNARDYIPAVTNRVRRGVETWAKTGELTGVPDELKGMLTGPGAALGVIGGMLGSIGSAIGGAVSAVAGAIGGAFSSIGKALFKRKEGQAEATDDPQEIPGQLRGGQPLDSGAKSRMGAAFGYDFSGVRVHTGAQAAGISDDLNARAFTVGSDIAFGPGEYQPGTMIGDALIAHELAHVIQQSGGATAEVSEATNGEPEHSTMEADADLAAISVVSNLWSNMAESAGSVAANAVPRLRAGLQLQRCPKTKKSHPTVNVSSLPAGPIRAAVLKLSQSDQKIDRNTARQLAEGHVQAFYYEDLAHPTDPIEDLLAGYGIAAAEAAKYTIYLHPITKAEMVVQKNFTGSRHGTAIFGSRKHRVEDWALLLVHEANHVVNPPVKNILDKYKSEFRAYWVAEFREISNLNERAKQVKKNILHDYVDIRDAYNKDLDVKVAIDAYTRPEGDLTNVTGLSKAPPRPAKK